MRAVSIVLSLGTPPAGTFRLACSVVQAAGIVGSAGKFASPAPHVPALVVLLELDVDAVLELEVRTEDVEVDDVEDRDEDAVDVLAPLADDPVLVVELVELSEPAAVVDAPVVTADPLEVPPGRLLLVPPTSLEPERLPPTPLLDSPAPEALELVPTEDAPSPVLPHATAASREKASHEGAKRFSRAIMRSPGTRSDIPVATVRRSMRRTPESARDSRIVRQRRLSPRLIYPAPAHMAEDVVGMTVAFGTQRRERGGVVGKRNVAIAAPKRGVGRIMRTWSPIAFLAALAVGAISTDARAQDDSYSDQDPSALADFNPALNAHGSWINNSAYGEVWVPNANEVGADFTPYVSGGHWVYGDDYLWVSDYDWGWVPFHYGRWAYAGDLGSWAWVPGREYAPAWVDWRVGDEYVGWAPTAPTYIWRGGLPVVLDTPPEAPFVYCPQAELFSPVPVRAVFVGPRAFAFRGRTHAYFVGGGDAHAHHGPPPESIGIPASRVAHSTGQEPGVARAQGFGRPSTAQRMGGHAPARGFAMGSPGGSGRSEGRGESGGGMPRGETGGGRESSSPGRESSPQREGPSSGGRASPGGREAGGHEGPAAGAPAGREPAREPQQRGPQGAPPRGSPPPQQRSGAPAQQQHAEPQRKKK
jgi:hypothetical protein